MKNLVASLLFTSAVLAGSILGFSISDKTVFAAAQETKKGFSWSVDGTKLIISGEGYMPDYSYGYTPWYYNDSRGDYAYNYITEVEIGEGIKSICDYAFYKYEELSKVTLPSTLETIGYEAFYNDDKIETLAIPNPVTSLTIGNEAFMWCSGLKGLQIGDLSNRTGKIILDKECFENCESLETVFISKNVSSIGGEAFNDCDSLTDVYCYPDVSSYDWDIVDEYYNSYFIDANKHNLYLSTHYYIDRISLENNDFLPFKVVKETSPAPYLAHNERFHWYSVRGDIVFKECHTFENHRCKYCNASETKFSDTVIDVNTTNLTDGIYVVDKITDLGNATITVDGNASIIVKDNCGLTLKGGILLTDTSSLTIYAEHNSHDYFANMGYIRSENTIVPDSPGIGSKNSCTATTVNIYGGKIYAKGNNAAGIGTFANTQTINIHGGIIQSYGDKCGAGIGGSNYVIDKGSKQLGPWMFGDANSNVLAYSKPNISIYSGDIIAKGGLTGAGIGSGERGSSNVRIFGGYIEASSQNGTSIGGGYEKDTTNKSEFESSIYLYGGTILADVIGGTKSHPSSITISSDFNGLFVGKISNTNTVCKGNQNFVGTGAYISEGSIVIISVVSGVLLLSVAVFFTFYHKNKKKVSKK